MPNITENQARTYLRLLEQLEPHWRRDPALPARIQSLLGRREFGSRDRRLYRELLYTTLRALPWIEPYFHGQPDEAVRRVAWLAAESPATKLFCAAFASGEPPAGDRAELSPAWFRAHCPEIFSGSELDAQLRRAPLWLRLQTSRADRVLDEFDERAWQWRRSELLPDAVEVFTQVDVTKSDAWAHGDVEVQDLGSQLILAAIGIEAGGRWLDACAGAGGKTLQLARLLGGSGMIEAHDIRSAALDELVTRARRARLRVSSEGMTAAESHSDRYIPSKAAIRILNRPPQDWDGLYDGVLVDAPCSGSGTWRRAPHLKWVTTEAQVARSAETQRALLHRFSARVKPDGRLVYATCSLSSQENEAVVASFLAEHPEFAPAPFARTFGAVQRGAGLLILPGLHDTDGFFVASLRRTGGG